MLDPGFDLEVAERGAARQWETDWNRLHVRVVGITGPDEMQPTIAAFDAPAIKR